MNVAGSVLPTMRSLRLGICSKVFNFVGNDVRVWRQWFQMKVLFRRRLIAEGAKPESNNRWKSELGYVLCMYVLGWVGMVFGIISRAKARSATNEVPKCRSPERALLRHHIIGVRLLTSARRAKLPR